jgi:hypothetical protein
MELSQIMLPVHHSEQYLTPEDVVLQLVHVWFVSFLLVEQTAAHAFDPAAKNVAATTASARIFTRRSYIAFPSSLRNSSLRHERD